MGNGWSGAAPALCRGAFGLALLAVCGVVACAGSSKSNGAPSNGDAGEGGRGGSGVAGSGAAGSGGAGAAASGAGGSATGAGGAGSGGTSGAAGGAGSGGTSGEAGGAGERTEGGAAGSAGEANGGASGVAAGGGAGDDASHAGEASGGAGGGCQNWCSEANPACCGEALSCVESAPSCRIEILAASVDVIYDYEELEAEIATLSGALAATIPLSEVELAAADPSPAARFEMTLNADASDDFAALTGMYLHPFRLACDDRELFVGVVYMREGAAAIETPVLHADPSETGALVLRLGAWQSAWLISGGGDAVLRERIDRPELRAEFCARGVLAELE